MQNISLLGVHAIGESATEIIHIGQTVLALGGTIEFFRDSVFNYPTFAEAYKIAALNGLNKVRGRVSTMKRCPTCKRVYDDLDLMFCRVDGAALFGLMSLPRDLQETVVLSDSHSQETVALSDSPLQETAVLSDSSSQ